VSEGTPVPVSLLTWGRYQFYLDEMIAIHNRELVKELQRTGQRPHSIPENVLRGTASS
jgi:hypothetical protein